MPETPDFAAAQEVLSGLHLLSIYNPIPPQSNRFKEHEKQIPYCY